jgi:hypothetical protein
VPTGEDSGLIAPIAPIARLDLIAESMTAAGAGRHRIERVEQHAPGDRFAPTWVDRRHAHQRSSGDEARPTCACRVPQRAGQSVDDALCPTRPRLIRALDDPQACRSR